MSVVFVANVGERDIYYNVSEKEGEPDFCHFRLGTEDERKVAKYLGCKNGARYIAEAILKRLDENKEEFKRLRYPILKTVINKITKGGKIDKLFLIVTDQPKTVDERYRCTDSVNSGVVLKELIERDYNDKIPKPVEVIKFGEDLSKAREQYYEFLGNELSKKASERTVREFHASLSGGMPAFNDNLRDQAINLYRAKCHLYDVVPPTDQELKEGAEVGTLQPVSAKPFLKDIAIGIVEQLIDRYDYSGALEVLNTFRAVKFWRDEVEAVLKHAERRINFSFNDAKSLIGNYKTAATISTWYKDVDKPDLLNRLAETYFIAETRYNNREYADMIWRVSAFYENGLRLVASKTLKIAELSKPGVKHLLVNKLKEKHLGLNDQMESDSKATKTRDKKYWNSDVYNFKKFCQYGLSLLNDENKEKWNEIFELLCSLDRLSQLRNEVIHNFAGISENEINNYFDPSPSIRVSNCDKKKNHKFVISTLNKIVLSLNDLLKRGDLRNPYREINDYIKETLR